MGEIMENSFIPYSHLDDEYGKLLAVMGTSISKHLIDEHFTVLWANDFYYEIIGYSQSEYEALFQNKCDIYFENNQVSWNIIKSKVEAALQNKENKYEAFVHLERKDKSIFWAKLVSTFTDQYINGYQVAFTTMTDVSEMVQMHTEQSITYDNIPGFVAKYRIENKKFVLLDANKKFMKFFGLDKTNFKDYVAFSRVAPDSQAIIKHNLPKMYAGESVSFIVHNYDINENPGWFQVNGACIGWEKENPIYMIFYIDITDITELREMQKQLQEALQMAEHANRAKSDFLSHMSHDIRTPMNAIVGMTEIAFMHLDDSEKIQDCLKKIALSSQHLLGLINDVLDMSRIESGKMVLNNSTTSLAEIMENVVAIIQPSINEKSQNFAVHLYDMWHEQFFCDSLRLRQVFLNILSNACKFTPYGGSITMEVQELPSENSSIALLQFTFKDTGRGIKPEFQNNIFDAFSRERDSRVDHIEGSGLGLAITKKIIDIMGGTIQLESTYGVGTTFCIRLPLTIDMSPFPMESLPNLHILLVDDDIIMCEHTMHTLEKIGVMAEWVNKGSLALKKLQEAAACGKMYDVVILDWKMPDMDGVQTTHLIRKQFGKELPILIVSAYDKSSIETEAKNAGVNGFLSKPLFMSTLCRGLQKYVLKIPSKHTEKENHTTDFTDKRILLVEDNELNREIAVELLMPTGIKVETACNGAEGVKAFENSSHKYFDLILMDIQMPIMDGYTATETIRKLNRPDAAAIPIFAMTADAFSSDVEHARKVGMNGHLAKPIDISQMMNILEKYL